MIDFHAARMLVADAENMRLDEIDENGLEDNEAYMVSYKSPDDPLLRAGNPGVHFLWTKLLKPFAMVSLAHPAHLILIAYGT